MNSRDIPPSDIEMRARRWQRHAEGHGLSAREHVLKGHVLSSYVQARIAAHWAFKARPELREGSAL